MPENFRRERHEDIFAAPAGRWCRSRAEYFVQESKTFLGPEFEVGHL